jgi:outer membrane immunogenic protein
MMKKMIVYALALAVLGTNSGLAADLGRPYAKAPPSPPPYSPGAQIYNWTGFYIGGHLGGSFGGSSSFFRNDTRFLGGLQVGGDYQFAPNWVIGIEGQYSWLPGKARALHFDSFDLTRDRKALGSVTGRLGYTWGPTLLYVKGGYAYQDTTYRVASLGGPIGVTLDGNKKSGYTVGAGLEYLFTPNWSSKIEYQYYNFGRARFIGASPTGLVTAGSFDNNVHSVKVGLNYRFN